jgi:hypothetical protein
MFSSGDADSGKDTGRPSELRVLRACRALQGCGSSECGRSRTDRLGHVSRDIAASELSGREENQIIAWLKDRRAGARGASMVEYLQSLAALDSALDVDLADAKRETRLVAERPLGLALFIDFAHHHGLSAAELAALMSDPAQDVRQALDYIVSMALLEDQIEQPWGWGKDAPILEGTAREASLDELFEPRSCDDSGWSLPIDPTQEAFSSEDEG